MLKNSRCCVKIVVAKGETDEISVRARRRDMRKIFALPESASSGTSHWVTEKTANKHLSRNILLQRESP